MGFYMIFAASALPLPATPTLVITGALARQGILNWYAAFIFALTGTLIADLISYSLGRFGGGWVDRHIGSRFGDSWFKAQGQFNQYGGWAIFLSRSLLASLDVPINMFAGASKYSIRKFIIIDLFGIMFYISIFGGTGYFVSSQYEAIIRFIEQYTFWIAAFIIALLALYLLFHYVKRKRSEELERFPPAASSAENVESVPKVDD